MFQNIMLGFCSAFLLELDVSKLDINLSKSASYHMLSAPAAPAPKATINIPITDCWNETEVGAVNRPTAQVKITRDITLGFINFNNSGITPNS